MIAAVIREAGGPEKFLFEERPIPEPKDGWVLIKVKAFGLSRSEAMTRKGLSPSVKFPRVLGVECVGKVEYDPSGQFQSGQKVTAFMGEMGRAFDGSYAEYAVLPKSILSPFDSQLPWEILGAIPGMFQTVYGSLHLALNIKRGEVLLIRGGSSSLGLLAAQVAKNFGLTVIATSRNAEKETLLLNNGADHFIVDDGNLPAKVKELYPTGVDKVLELVGTSTLKDSLQCAAPGGAVCMTGMLSEQWSISDFTPMDYIASTVNLTTYNSGQTHVDLKSFHQFIREVENGEVKLPIGQVFKFSDLVKAHQLIDSNSANGKIVIVT